MKLYNILINVTKCNQYTCDHAKCNNNTTNVINNKITITAINLVPLSAASRNEACSFSLCINRPSLASVCSNSVGSLKTKHAISYLMGSLKVCTLTPTAV